VDLVQMAVKLIHLEDVFLVNLDHQLCLHLVAVVVVQGHFLVAVAAVVHRMEMAVEVKTEVIIMAVELLAFVGAVVVDLLMNQLAVLLAEQDM
jgi:hypothetical protein